MLQPNEVTAYLRRGMEGANGHYTEPRLEFLAADGVALASVLLFDIRFFEIASPLQIQPYPLAIPGNSVILRTTQSEFVFEGGKEEDIVRLIHGMRWLIARLSFNLIIGKPQFFSVFVTVDRIICHFLGPPSKHACPMCFADS